MFFYPKYAVLITNNENINKMIKKSGYQIYSCYSNEFDKNILFARPFWKLLLKWTEFWLASKFKIEKKDENSEEQKNKTVLPAKLFLSDSIELQNILFVTAQILMLILLIIKNHIYEPIIYGNVFLNYINN